VRSCSFIAETRRTQRKRGEYQAKNGYREWGGGLVFRQVLRARRTKQVRQIRHGLSAGILQRPLKSAPREHLHTVAELVAPMVLPSADGARQIVNVITLSAACVYAPSASRRAVMKLTCRGGPQLTAYFIGI
jgi:hypothetical protein